MYAVILAAGCGRRMLPLSASCHKGLLPIGDTTALDRLVEELSDVGVSAITVVTGYRADDVEAQLCDRHPNAPLEFVHNARYATTNNVVSLGLALERAPSGEDLLLVECDLLLAPRTLSRLAAGPSRNVALVDRFRIGMDGTVVSTDGGLVVAIHPPDEQGEDFEYRDTYKTLNVYRFTATAVADVLVPLVAGCDDEHMFYEAVLSRVPDLAALRIAAEEVPAGSWIEVDDPVDLAAARFAFAPHERAAILDSGHGGRWGFDLLDFSFMANVRFPTAAMLAAMRHALVELIGSYGSARKVVDEKLSWLLGCEPSRLLTLAGASQAYPLLGRYWAGARVAIPAPTFGEYARTFPDAARYQDRPGIGIDLDVLDDLAAEQDLLVVVNPNNPTGTTIAAERLHALASRHPTTTVLVDESFAGFADGPPLRELLEAAPLRNVVLLTSLGKLLGVSGLRLGYLYSDDGALLDLLAAELPVWSLSSQAEHFLELTLKARPELEESLRRTIVDREGLRQALVELSGIAAVHPSGGNFVLVDLEGPAGTAATLRNVLLECEAIAIKDVTGRFADGVPRVRLGVRLPEDNARLIAALARRLAPPVVAGART